MQHGCNKHARGIFEHVATLYDDIIEDMLADADRGGEIDPRDAVELAELVHAVNLARHADGRPPSPCRRRFSVPLLERHWA